MDNSRIDNITVTVKAEGNAALETIEFDFGDKHFKGKTTKPLTVTKTYDFVDHNGVSHVIPYEVKNPELLTPNTSVFSHYLPSGDIESIIIRKPSSEILTADELAEKGFSVESLSEDAIKMTTTYKPGSEMYNEFANGYLSNQQEHNFTLVDAEGIATTYEIF